MRCICGSELTGRQKYCSDRCRMRAKRTQTEPESEQPEQINPNKPEPEHQPEQDVCGTGIMTARSNNPDLINTGSWLDADDLRQAGYKANRVPLPGDNDYHGVASALLAV